MYQLSQQNDRLPIAFASRSLRGPELNYTVTEKELLAIIYSLSKFRTLIYGCKVIIKTDHRALEFLAKCNLQNEPITRWVLFLNDFQYKIQHIPTKENIVADTLSRYPPDSMHKVSSKEPIVANLTISLVNTIKTFQANPDLTHKVKTILSNLATYQYQDQKLKKIIDQLKNNPRNSTSTNIDRYELFNNVLLYLDGPKKDIKRFLFPQN